MARRQLGLRDLDGLLQQRPRGLVVVSIGQHLAERRERGHEGAMAGDQDLALYLEGAAEGRLHGPAALEEGPRERDVHEVRRDLVVALSAEHLFPHAQGALERNQRLPGLALGEQQPAVGGERIRDRVMVRTEPPLGPLDRPVEELARVDGVADRDVEVSEPAQGEQHALMLRSVALEVDGQGFLEEGASPGEGFLAAQ